MKNLLRFKEFTSDWVSTKNKNILKICYGQNQSEIEDKNGVFPILGSGGIIGKTNSFLYNKPSVLIGRKGTINKPYYYETPFWTVDTLFYTQIKENANPKFVYYLFQTINWNKFSEQSGVPSLAGKVIENINICIPLLKEQNKIATFLNLYYKKIELQKKKIELLLKFKNGFFFKFLSKYDCTYRISDIFNITRGFVLPKSDLKTFPDIDYKYPTYSSQTTNQGILGYSKNYLFDGNCITWTTDGANAGQTFLRKNRFNCTNVCGVLLEKEKFKGYANSFVCAVLNTLTPKYVSYVGNPKLMNNTMGNIKINLPNLHTQIFISKAIDDFNKLIFFENKKLQLLEQYKKGLLQQMFI